MIKGEGKMFKTSHVVWLETHWLWRKEGNGAQDVKVLLGSDENGQNRE